MTTKRKYWHINNSLVTKKEVKEQGNIIPPSESCVHSFALQFSRLALPTF